MQLHSIICLSFMWTVAAYIGVGFRSRTCSKFRTILREMPLELTGQLDPSKSWTVKLIYGDEVKETTIAEDTSVLELGEKLFKNVPSSCRTGVCTTCSAKVVNGLENTRLAVHGFGKDIIAKGFVCACQTYVVGPDVQIILGTSDEVYEEQYGQYEESYEMKFGKKKGDIKRAGGLY